MNFIDFSGNVINIQTGEWVGRMSGLGAGLDSFFEYMLKVIYHQFCLSISCYILS